MTTETTAFPHMIVQEDQTIVIRLNADEHVELFYGCRWFESRPDQPGYVFQHFTNDSMENWDLPEGCLNAWTTDCPSKLIDQLPDTIQTCKVNRFRMVCALERSRTKFVVDDMADEIGDNFGMLQDQIERRFDDLRKDFALMPGTHEHVPPFSTSND